MQASEVSPFTLEKSNVLQFLTENGSLITVRPSGTEPKIKFYISANTQLNNASEFHKTTKQLEAKIDAIVKDMKLN